MSVCLTFLLNLWHFSLFFPLCNIPISFSFALSFFFLLLFTIGKVPYVALPLKIYFLDTEIGYFILFICFINLFRNYFYFFFFSKLHTTFVVSTPSPSPRLILFLPYQGLCFFLSMYPFPWPRGFMSSSPLHIYLFSPLFLLSRISLSLLSCFISLCLPCPCFDLALPFRVFIQRFSSLFF